MKQGRGHSYRAFLTENRRLLLFLGLLLAGTVGGVIAFRVSGGTPSAVPPPLQPTLASVATAWVQCCTGLWTLLGVLFVAGLATWGAPVALLVPVFFGLGIGMGEAMYVSLGTTGLAYTALLVLPGRLFAAAALLPGCSESMRFSLQLGRQVLLRNARGGGMLRDLQMYCIRFLVFFGISAFAGAVDVLLRLLFGSVFSAAAGT